MIAGGVVNLLLECLSLLVVCMLALAFRPEKKTFLCDNPV
jgi:cbb3-type cytochrome oxidase subunit 3